MFPKELFQDWKKAAELLASHFPSLWKLWQSPRFIAPPRGEHLYPNWDKIALCETICACSGPTILENRRLQRPGVPSDPAPINSDEASVLLHWKMQEGCPTIYLEPELGEALLSTETPMDIPCTDIHWAFNTLRIILPKGLLKSDGMDILAIHGGIIPGGQTLSCPKAYKGTPAETLMESLCIETSMVWDAILDSPEGIVLHGFRPWNDQTLKEMHQNAQNEDTINKDEEKTILQASQILLNTILLLQAKPDYLQGEKTLRKANPHKGTNELRQGRLLGEFLQRRKQAAHPPGEDTGYKAPHR